MNFWSRGLHSSSNIARKAVELLSIIVIVLLAVSPPLFSQSAAGTILGGIFDSSGGSIAGAKVTVTDVARGTTRTLTTGSTGEYSAPSLLAGIYTVRAEAQGFEAVERSNVVLGVAQEVRVDLKLSPGAQTQTVTVTEEGPAIDTTNATLGGTVTNQSIADLPLLSRNFMELLQLRPGIVDTPGGGTSPGSSTTTNGRREGTDVLVIEGVTQFDLATSNVLINGANKGGGNTDLPLDAIQEFSTTQNSPAEYGWRDGSAINVGIKSGTNGYHGSAYAFGRDGAATDALTYVPGGVGTGTNLTVEQPGATFGGPIIKNKLFFFTAVEFVRSSSFNTGSITTPTDTPGTLNSIVDACNNLKGGRAAVNPLSALIAGLPPGSCTPLPATSTFENLFPFNTTGSPLYYPYNATSTPSNNGLAKIDYSPNDKNHMSGLVYISRQTTSTGGTYQPYWGTNGIGSTSEYAGSWTYTPNSSWVNDLRGGAAPNLGSSVPEDSNKISGNPYPTGYGINSGVTNPLYGGFMCVAVQGGTGTSTTTGLGDCGRTGPRGPQYQLDFSDKVSHLVGNHSIKFGYELVFVHFDDGSTANTPGLLSFSSLANFLTGTITKNGSITVGDTSDHYRERWHAAFVQDTWRISPKVTLSPGLRWEYVGAPYSTVNHLGQFDPNQPGGLVQVGPNLPNSSVTHPQKTNFNPRVGVAYDIFGNGKTVLRAGIGNLSSFPAILTIAGAVPYADTLCNGPGTALTCTNPANIVVNHYGTPLQSATSVPTLKLAVTPAQFNWTASCTDPANSTTCSTPVIFPVGSSLSATSGPTCSTTVPCSVFTTDPYLKSPKSIQYNIDLQRALTNRLTLDVAYVGVHGYNEIHSIDLNQPALGTGWDASAVNSCLGAMASAANGWISKCSPDAPAEAAARPYNAQFPYLSYILQSTNGFRSNYSGLQVTLDARNFHGLHFLTAYTYGHALDDWTKSSQNTTALANPANPQYNYGNSDMDVRQRLRFSPTYQIPGIKSPGQMLEGWQISAIWAYQTGFAWAPSDQTTNDWGGTNENGNPTSSPNGGVWQSWNYSGPRSAFSAVNFTPIPCYGQATSCTPLAQAPVGILQVCMNAAQAPYATPTLKALAVQSLTSSSGACYIQNGGVLTPPAYGTLGNASRGLFTGPRFQQWDFSLAKNWHIKERYSTELRIECFNCFNHVNAAQFADGSSDPSSGTSVVGGTGFGYHGAIQGAMRRMEFGLKIAF